MSRGPTLRTWRLGAVMAAVALAAVVLAACGDSGETTTTPTAATTIASTVAPPTRPPPTRPPPTAPPPTQGTTPPTTVDTTPPLLVIDNPRDGDVFTQQDVLFSGRATPGAAVRTGRLTANSEADGAWSIILPLSPGENVVRFTATSLAGVSSETAVTVIYQPPTTTTTTEAS